MKTTSGKQHCRLGNHGAVSTFLAIILIPCIVFVCVFADLSRVQLARSVSESAADLALDSVLTNYDLKLQEYYGLVASCQNIDEFLDKSEEYFTNALKSEGLSEEVSNSLTAYLDSLRGSNSFSDFLQIEFTEEPKIEKVTDASLGKSPALIEDQVVEFMKYRGPIEILTKFIQRIKDSGAASSLEEAEKDKPLVEAKQKYAEAEGDLMKAAFYSYLAMYRYQQYVDNNNGILSVEGYEKIPENVGRIQEDLRKVAQTVAQYYKNTDNLKKITWPSAELPEAEEAKDVATSSKEENNTKTYYVSDADVDEVLDDAKTLLETLESYADQLCSRIQSVGDPTAAGMNLVQYCVQVQHAVEQDSKLSGMQKTADDLMKAYAKLAGMKECSVEDGSMGRSTEIDNKLKEIEKAQKNYLDTPPTGNSYAAAVTRYNTLYDQNCPQVKNKTCVFRSAYLGRDVTIGEFAQNASQYLSNLHSVAAEAMDRLDIIINGGKFDFNGKKIKCSSLDKLADMAEEYQISRDNWVSEVEKSETDYGKEEKQEIADLEANQDSTWNVAKEIDREKVEELKNRLSIIQGDVTSLKKAVESFKYNNKTVKDLDSHDKLVNPARNAMDEQQITIWIDKNDQLGDSVAGSIIQPAPGQDVYTAPPKQHDHVPDLDDPPKPKLYEFLYEQFYNDVSAGKLDEDVANNDGKLEEMKGEEDKQKDSVGNTEADSAVKESQDLAALVFAQPDIWPSAGAGADASLADIFTSVPNLLKTVTSGNFDSIRDRLYVCEYIMDMCGYSSYPNEGRYRLCVDNNVTVNYPNYMDAYSQEKIKKAWESEKTWDTYNKSLTNRLINTQNNYAYRSEVEYILYGAAKNADGAKPEENLKAAYLNIFGVRMALNVISGFRFFYSGDNTTRRLIEGIATLVQNSTAGIIPVPLTKCVLIGVLTAFESARDVGRLKAGLPVAFFKKELDQWHTQIATGSSLDDFQTDSSQASKAADENGLYYSDYLYIFLLTATQNSEKYQDILKRLGDVIQSNMQLVVGGEEEEKYTLTKSYCYFKIYSKMRVKPLMLDLPVVTGYKPTDFDFSTVSSYTVDTVRGYS